MKRFHDVIGRLTALYDEHEARALAQYLFEERFGLGLADLATDADERLNDEQEADLEVLVGRLCQAEPIQYVLGKTTFCGCTLNVNPSVLIPRPETQQLVNMMTGAPECQRQGAAILDIGTGSGAIAIALAHALPQVSVAAWDISEEALQTATANARLNKVDVSFCLQDALRAPKDERLWDVIVSNPPYVCLSEKNQMERNVLDFEPALALFVNDDDPLLFYRAIGRYAASALRPGGSLYFEINPLFAEPLEALLREQGFREIVISDDYFGKKRFAKCHKKP